MTTDLIGIRPEVHAGVALLKDSTRWEEINPATLNMGRCRTCVLGQLFGDYADGTMQLGLAGGTESKFGFELSEQGLASLARWRHYDRLGEEWKAVIAALRNGTYDPAVSTYPRYGGEA